MTVIDSEVVLAPMAGGPGTVDLAAAVAGAGGFGFLPGGYLALDALAARIRSLRSMVGDVPFGVNLFVPQPPDEARAALAGRFADAIRPWADRAGVQLGNPSYSDDAFDAKVDVLCRARVPVVSTVFGWPSQATLDRLASSGCEVWLTINESDDAERAVALGVSGFVAQGWEAGGHRGGPNDDAAPNSTVGLLSAILQRSDLPVIAAGGVMTRDDVVNFLGLGARAVQCGTAFLLSPEAGTSGVHRKALAEGRDTVVTRAFTGRRARALRNRWTDESGEAPAAFPELHAVTSPLRAHGLATGDADLAHLWAGSRYRLAEALPAAEVTSRLLGQ